MANVTVVNGTLPLEPRWAHRDVASLLAASGVENAGVAEYVWGFLLLHLSDWSLFSWFFWLFGPVGSEVLSGLFFYVVDRTGWFRQYKIQAKHTPNDALYWKCIRGLLFNYVCVILPLAFMHPVLMDVLQIQTAFPLPSWTSVIGHIFLFLIIEDILQYVLHRALHYGWLYRYIHKEHHTFKYPFGIAASYAHWAEVLILAIPTYSGPLLFRPHLFTTYMWVAARNIDSVDTHCGYDLPWHWSNFMPFYGGARFHDFHHEAFDCNYASRFTILDMLFGTYREVPYRPVEPASDNKRKKE